MTLTKEQAVQMILDTYPEIMLPDVTVDLPCQEIDCIQMPLEMLNHYHHEFHEAGDEGPVAKALEQKAVDRFVQSLAILACAALKGMTELQVSQGLKPLTKQTFAALEDDVVEVHMPEARKHE